jgi:thiosulfate/3-mercaptopyruvate sulfurtransferase
MLRLRILLAVLIVALTTACAESDKNSTDNGDIASCEGCHTNYETLKAIAAPDTTTGGGGCGGDAPHIDRWDRVYLGGTGFTDFKNSTHGTLACTQCHNGMDGTSDKVEAHSGDFISHPSTFSQSKCGTCHNTVVTMATNSLHQQGWGQKRMVFLRAGLNSFDELSETMKAGYQTNCAKCHASCGECHVNRPKTGGGGLYKGHRFGTPDMRDQCVACHSSRGGHAFFGIGTGTVPDVHYSQLGMECLDCHTGSELHGNGQTLDTRWKTPSLPSCTSCHSNISTSNAYHTEHLGTFSCYTCHSQNYNNCGSCHIGGEGARIVSHQSFKIGMNPIKDIKTQYKFALLRRSLSAPDSWDLYGTSSLSNFGAAPTFKYTTPHNIQRWTTRTRVATGQPCYDNCHIVYESGTYRNRNLYLFNSDLLETWELTADTGIVVDGKLPPGWGTP